MKSPNITIVHRVCTRVTVGKRFAVYSGAKNMARQFPPSFEFTFTLSPKKEKPLPPKTTAALNYRRKNTAIFWHYRLHQIRYRQKNDKTADRQILPPYHVLHYRRKPTDILRFYHFRQSRHRLKITKPPTAKKLPPYGNTPPPVSAYKTVTENYPDFFLLFSRRSRSCARHAEESWIRASP